MTTTSNNLYDVELASVSTKLDGRASIEHQIDIHVLDLIQIENIPEISLDDVLQGLKYVVDYRIKHGKMKNLDLDLMKRLLGSLLQHMAGKEGSLIFQKPTVEADLALSIFGEFLEEVQEFQIAVSEKSPTDLRHALKIHRRCQPNSSEEEKELAASILALLTTNFPQFSDWRDLVKESEHDDVEKLIEQYREKFERPEMPSVQNSNLFPPQVLFFDKNIVKLAEMYQTDMENGLKTERFKILKNHYGINKLPDPPKPSILKMLFTQLTDFIVIILIVVAIAQVAMGEIVESIILFAVVVINVIIGFSQEYKANKALEALSSLSVPKAAVVRDGRRETVDATDLVPGDLVILEEGDAVPADLRIVESSQLEIIEAILTGESIPTRKATKTIRKRTRKLPLGDCKGNAFMTTVVAKGRGKGIVVRIGTQTEIGKISEAITSQPHQQTSIQKKLTVLGKWLVGIALVLCALVVVISYGWNNPIKEAVMIGVSLGVSVIPEGLVAVTTVTMAIGVTNMARLNAIVRKLPSVETLGSVKVICSDKTGTLTEGKMGTLEIWTFDNSLYTFSNSTSLDPSVGAAFKGKTEPFDQVVNNPSNIDTIKHQQEKEDLKEMPKNVETCPPSLVIASMIAGLCNNADVVPDQENKGAWKPLGDPTEVAMVVASQKAGFSKSVFANMGMAKLCEYAFDSERKMMSVIFKCSSEVFGSETAFVLAKGAPEKILARSTHFLPDPPANCNFVKYLQNAVPLPCNEAFMQLVSQRNRVMAESGLRVLALAIRKVSLTEAQEIEAAKKSEVAESQLTFVGLIGLIDPPKAGVADSVADCKRAGIKVIMITGDHIATATAIARQLGIYDPSIPAFSRSMKGEDVDLLSEENLADLNPFPVVFARVSPDNKLKIVKALQSKKLSVAMTGDGVNDAPAIKKADVGVAMGIGGTEITKQAADIVLADDNFTTIVAAVKEGRRVFDNIKKFVVYLLSCNSAEIFLFLMTSSLNLEMPFEVTQILWANIVADVPPAMSLGVEPYEDDIMDRPPRPETEGVLTVPSALIVLAQGFIQSSLTLGVYIFAGVQPKKLIRDGNTIVDYQIIDPKNAFLSHDHHNIHQQQSLAFGVLMSMQLFQSFLSKSVTLSIFTTGFTSNKWMIYAFILSFVLMVMGFYVPGLNTFLSNEPLVGSAWATIFVCLIIQTIAVELIKLTARNHQKRKNRKIMNDNA